MNQVAFAVLGYVGGTFLLSALIVRFLPDNFSARQIRKQMVLFLVLPLLLIVDVVYVIDAIARSAGGAVSWIFEVVSGRRLYRQTASYYGYGSNRRSSSRRTSRHAKRVPSKRRVPVERRG